MCRRNILAQANQLCKDFIKPYKPNPTIAHFTDAPAVARPTTPGRDWFAFDKNTTVL